MKRPVAFVAPLPPPVHGFSNICAAMLDLLETRSVVTVFNRAPRIDLGLFARFRPLTDIVRYCIWCAINTNAALYLGLSGGLGQFVDLPYIVIGRLFRRRIYVHHHSYAYINAPSRLNRLLFSLLRDQPHIVLSQCMGSELTRIYKLNPSLVKIVSNAAFHEAGAEAGRPSDTSAPLRLGYLSAVSFEKGIAEFFAVLARLKQIGVPYRGYVAGPMTSGMQAEFANLLASSSDVSYSGPIYGDAKTTFYQNLDILLFPSDYANEAEPLVIHEAMRNGVHVIACERGAIAEILSDGAGIVCAKPVFVATAVDHVRDFSADAACLRRAQQLSLEKARRMRDLGAMELATLLDGIGTPAGGLRESTKGLVRGVVFAAFICTFALAACNRAFGEVANHDALERALVAPDVPANQNIDSMVFFVAGQTSHDNNIFRLPASIVDLTALVGPRASREDRINTASLGLDGNWLIGKQVITLDLDADVNRFVRNDNLNNVLSNDAVKWNWVLGDRVSGQVGADFRRSLGSFYNTFDYRRDLVDQTESFGAARYAVGPHIVLFGGILYTDTSLSETRLKINDNQRKAVDFGLEYATSVTRSLDFEYRYTDARYSHRSILNGVAYDPDYRDKTAHITFKDALSEKTQIEAVVGYLKRAYPNTVIGAFSGNIWRLLLDWHPTDKTQLVIAGSRDLQADLSAQTDYFASKAVSISPTWIPSEKITFAVTLSRDEQDFIGVNEFAVSVGTRRDLVNAGQISIAYLPLYFTPARGVTFDFTFRREHRTSNQATFSYDDSIVKAGLAFKF